MNFKISSWAIRHPIPIIVLFLLLTVLGIRAFQALPDKCGSGYAVSDGEYYGDANWGVGG